LVAGEEREKTDEAAPVPAEVLPRALEGVAVGVRAGTVSVPVTGTVPTGVDADTAPVDVGSGADAPGAAAVTVVTDVVTLTVVVVLGTVTGTVATGVVTVVPVGAGTVGAGTVGAGTVGAGTVGAGTVGAGTVGAGTVGAGTETVTVVTGVVSVVDRVVVGTVTVGSASCCGWLTASTFAAKKPAAATQASGSTARRLMKRSKPCQTLHVPLPQSFSPLLLHSFPHLACAKHGHTLVKVRFLASVGP
jgi:hypothetical protein